MSQDNLKICVMSHSSQQKSMAYGYGAARVVTTAWKYYKNAQYSFHDLKIGYGSKNYLAIIEGEKPDILGLSVFMWNIAQVEGIIAGVRRSLPNTMIVLGGPSGVGFEVVSKSEWLPDFIVNGDGEMAFLKLIEDYGSGVLKENQIFSIPPLDRRKGLFTPGIVELNTDALNLLGSPYLERVYTPPGEMMYIETSRGCPNTCSFCIEGLKSRKIRHFDMNTIRLELTWAVSQGCNKIDICDSALNYNTGRLREFVESTMRVDGGDRLSYTFALHSDYLNEEQIKLMSNLRIDCATMGLNSIEPETFAAVGRKIDPEKFSEKVTLLKELRNPNITILLGLPGDTPEGFRRTLDYCASLNIQVNCYELKVFPGTRFFENATDFEIKYDLENEMNIVSSYSFSQDDLNVMRETLKEYVSAGSDFYNGDDII